jgi:hypothetical protein
MEKYLDLLLEDLHDVLADHELVICVLSIEVVPLITFWVRLTFLISKGLEICGTSGVFFAIPLRTSGLQVPVLPRTYDAS